MNHDAADRLAPLFQVVFPDLGGEAIRAARIDQVEGWDSLATVTLIALAEEEFDMKFDDAQIENATSFAAICEAVSGE